MSELRKLALERVRELLAESEQLTWQTATKLVSVETESLRAEKDILPIGRKIKEADKWLKAMVDDDDAGFSA